jgi:hypothetical protein|tara:strand:- start:131 stop:541 length:411 start_codon:yes stop_codon:yes gene_type:complete
MATSQNVKALNKEHNRIAEAKAKGIALDTSKGSFNTSTKSSSINPNSKLSTVGSIAKKYSHKFNGQMGIIFTMLEQNDWSVNLQQANELWISLYVDTGIYEQDLITVVNHYRGVFNSKRGYKQIPSEDLRQLLKIS